MLTGVAQVLVATNTLSREVVTRVYQQAVQNKTPFVPKLVASKLISSRHLALVLHRALHLPLLDLAALDSQHLLNNYLTPDFCYLHRIIPLALRGQQLMLATDDPSNRKIIEYLRFTKAIEPVFILVDSEPLTKFLNLEAGKDPSKLSEILDRVTAQQGVIDEEIGEAESVTNSPVVKFLHKMLLDAIAWGASDLHFEPYEFNYRIRFRIDGELKEIIHPPAGIKESLASRIKIISNLNIAEKRLPQDGRTKLKVGDKSIDFRVSTLPTLFGEKIVIRILDVTNSQLNIDSLGYEPLEKQRLLEAIKRPYGMILATGPTGSGKTLSLYACLNILNQPQVNISTAEDPAEINLPGINQVTINDKAGLTFATTLRAFLRQDPDIIMVGEIRDFETADIAIKAAQTGHLVLSTLHTNDAPTTLTRMLNMGIAPFNIASSVTLITAQRLVRKLCQLCKQPQSIAPQTLLAAGFEQSQLNSSWLAYQPLGCQQCNNGFKGRIGIYQVMPISPAMQNIILNSGNAIDISNQAKLEGVKSLREAALIKVMQGVTSLAEVLAITKE